jgi:Xaa-Pro aminopeptidase
MTAEGMDALLIYSWRRGLVRYLSGYHPNYLANVALAVLPWAGAPALRIRFPFDLERARRESWIEDVAACAGGLANLILESVNVLRRGGLAGGRIGLAAGDNVIEELPYTLYALLKQELPEAELVEAGHLLRKARHLKSPAEFAKLRAAANLADAGIAAARQVIRPGCNEYEVVGAVEGELRRLGAEMHLVVISSKGESELIGPPEAKIIQPGDSVILEVAVQRLGYTAQVARVFFPGKPTPAQIEIYRATYAAYQAAVNAARLGNPPAKPAGTVAPAKPAGTVACADLAGAIREELDRRGLGEYLEQDMGHGIGIDLPEPPRIEKEDRTVLEPGMALVIHPAVRVPGVGGAFLGGTVLIHASGPEPLHVIPESPV